MHHSSAAVQEEFVSTLPLSHILVVEDDEGHALVTSTLLKLLGCNCTTVRTGAEAIEAAKSPRYSAIIMDIMLPDISGIEAAKRIRNADRKRGTPSIPIIATSVICPQDVEQLCAQTGMDGYLQKPLQHDDFNRMIQSFGVRTLVA